MELGGQGSTTENFIAVILKVLVSEKPIYSVPTRELIKNITNWKQLRLVSF